MTKVAWFQRVPLFSFFGLTFAWSWACWALSPAMKMQSPWLASVLMFVGSFGPSLAAVAVVATVGGRAAVRVWVGRCLQWRIGSGWFALAFLLPLLLMALAAAMHIALGGSISQSPASGHLLMTLVNAFLILLLGGPMGEEFGWRAYALPILQERFGWRMASLALGIVWGVWHLPLFFIEGTSQDHIPLVLFLVSVVAVSVLFAWFYRHTKGSIVVALLLHTAINFWSSVVPVLPTEESHRAYAFLVAMFCVLALGLIAWPRIFGAVPELSDMKP